ncbi:omega-6 fatty acid desaturase (delta-12 desaturase) [Blastomyces silverae]|uniref:Omega-6 fatty acid desaturase (Delta-12 desaturase) n=1 Tax=Blastomyces silverae TaxID=2060906 RepID=A0A0H1BN24_9EURO|nr:omega-6 fatty acid desaturase (delta-12 desaturase) [Blastomyces silverae]
MTSTALPKRMALNRNAPTDSSTESSACVSPSESLRPSPSSTSLSSLASDAQEEPLKLVDTYGNPFEIPDFTIKQIRDAIPAHCFKRSGLHSLGYVARDISALAGTFYLFHNYVTPEYIPSTPVRAGLWGLYTIVQGLFGTGLWIMAHECGHQAFSPSKLLNDTVGWICHSALLVPYFSWKISHGKHHKATGNIDRDMVFVPKTREVFASRYGYIAHELHELMEETPIQTATHMILQQLFGWPMYLLSNVTGHNNHERQPEGRGKGKKNGLFSGVNHFNPSSPLYEAKHVPLILLSDLGLMITGSALYWVGQNFGWANLAVWYFVPYLRHHLPPTHRPHPPPLHLASLELHPRRRSHHRPRIRLHRPLPLPRHHRNPRAAPLRPHDPVLQRLRGQRGHQARHGEALPLRHQGWELGFHQVAVEDCPVVPLGGAV